MVKGVTRDGHRFNITAEKPSGPEAELDLVEFMASEKSAVEALISENRRSPIVWKYYLSGF